MSIYQHFRQEEHDFIDQVVNWREYVERTYAPKLTDFLDPREQKIVKTIIGSYTEVKTEFFGGTKNTERKRVLLYPDYIQVDNQDFNITLFEVEYPKKFIRLTHPQVLGSLMSLGLKREKFGDINIIQDRVQFFCTGEIANYISFELQSIGKSNVQLREIPLSEALISEDQWSEDMVTVSSLRLDAIISSIYQISRQKSQTLIQSRLVKVNWTNIESTSFECGEGDTISVRGYGRSNLFSIDGKTKKEKWRISVGRQK